MECYKGWAKEDGNTRGRCCCNCKNQIEIMRHPWNTTVGGRMKGPVSETAGWGCMFPEFVNKAIFVERQHLVCEMHEFKIMRKSNATK